MFESAKVAVVVPAYREQRLIETTLASIPSWVDAVFAVDDASPDRTWHNIQQFAARAGSRVTPLRHANNAGVGAAIVTGYRAALEHGYDVMAVMAGDAQMDARELARVVGPVASGRADYVKGNRFAHPERSRMPLARRIGGLVLSALTRATTGLAVNDTQCGYTAISAAAVRALPLDRLWPRYGYPNDLLGMLAAHGFSVLEVPVRPVYAGEQSGLRAWHFVTIATLIVRRWLAHRRRKLGRTNLCS